MCIKLQYAKFDVSRLFCSKVIKEKPLAVWLEPPSGKGRVEVSFTKMKKKKLMYIIKWLSDSCVPILSAYISFLRQL